MIDFKEKTRLSKRRTLFKKYYNWSIRTNDCDPALFMMNYVNNRMELNIEQRFWFAWLYANTYNVATAWILFNEFPDFENVDIGRLSEWNTNNYKKLRYQVDNKWQKGHLPRMYESYRDNVYSKAKTQQEYFTDLASSDNEFINFDVVNKEVISKFFKFGRYLSWFYLQTLRETCGLRLKPDNLLLKDPASESHRNGLMYALGMDQIIEEDYKLDLDVYKYLDEEAAKIHSELEEEYPDIEVDYFTLETVFCAFKKVFRDKHGRYLGYYIDRQSEDILQTEEDGWSGIEWSLLWDARNETLDQRLLGGTVDKRRYGEYLRTGMIKNINWFDKA